MSFGNKLGEAALKIAKKMGNTKSLGKCALAVGDAVSAVLGESVAIQFRGNAYQWLPILKSNIGQKYWKFLKQSTDTTKLPAGSIVLWDRQPAHPYGHIEIADGKGHLISDFIRDDFRPIYVSNPAKIVPHIFVPVEVERCQDAKVPFDVKIKASALNIRTSSNTGAKIVDTVKKGTILTVWALETKGSSQWGKNSKGFFCLFDEKGEYTECLQ